MKISEYSNQLIEEFEIDANRKLALICRIGAGLLALIAILNGLNVFKIGDVIYPIMVFSILIMLLPTIFYNFLHNNSLITRYFVLTLMVLMSGVLYTFLSYHVIIMLIFPMVVSCLYCEKRCVWYTVLIGIPVMVVSHLLALYFKVVPDEPIITLKGALLYGVLPRLIEYISIATVCVSMTKKVQGLISSLQRKNEEILMEQESVINSLAQMMEGQSQETGMHVKRVAEYTKILCRKLGMEEDVVWKVGLAAMMHDVGKILIPHEILEKPGKLTDEEYATVKKHTVYGRRMLEKSSGELMQLSAKVAYEHHERYDGKGYAGLKGEEIDIFSRCVSVADVFDALVSWRPYKKAWTPEEAKNEIIAQSGTQFDPKVVTVFAENFEAFLEIYHQYPDSTEEVDTEAIFRE